ncbi:MAG: hypothetical protein ACYC8S_01370 [Minisyncoccota bacterium]
MRRIEYVLRWYMLPPEEIRQVVFGRTPQQILCTAYLWWHKQMPLPEVMNILMDEFNRGNIPVIYLRFMHKVVRPAMLFVNNKPVVGYKEVIKEVEEVIQKLKK